MTLLFGITCSLVTLKLLWNVALPWTVAVDLWRGRGRPKHGISLALIVEWLLLLIAIGLAWAASDLPDPLWVAAAGMGAVVGSYSIGCLGALFVRHVVLRRREPHG